MPLIYIIKLSRRIIIRKLTVTTNNNLSSSLCFASALENSKVDGEATKSVELLEVVKGLGIVVDMGGIVEKLSMGKVALEEIAGAISIEE